MTVAEANARWALVTQEISNLEKSALAHETAARADRLKREEFKEEARQLAATIQSEQAISAIQQAQADVKAAKAEADQHLESVKADREAAKIEREEATKLREEANQLLAELKAAKETKA